MPIPESWHPEHWDAVTLFWLRTKDGRDTLNLLRAAPELLECVRIALPKIKIAAALENAFPGKPASLNLLASRMEAALALVEGRS